MRAVIMIIVLAAALGATPARGAEPISWEETDHHVGEEATVEGRVLGVHCSQLSCLLAFDPTFNRFTVVIQAASFDTFPPAELDHRFSGKLVRVHGKIQTRDGKPEIVVAKTDELALVSGKK